MRLASTIRQRSAVGAKSRADLATKRVEGVGSTYNEARADLDSKVPEGWQVLGISTSQD